MITDTEIRRRFDSMDVLPFLAMPTCVLEWCSVVLAGRPQPVPLIRFLKAMRVRPHQLLPLDYYEGKFNDVDVSRKPLRGIANLSFPANEKSFALLAGIVGKPIKAARGKLGSSYWVYTIAANGKILKDWR